MSATRTYPSATYAVSTTPSVRRDAVQLGFILVLCVALRVIHLGSASLWTDEIFSRYYADLFGFHYLVTDGLSNEATPPTYPLLLQGWMAVWGHSEAAMRSMSVVASAACVPLIYALGREFGSHRQGLLAALLFAICPMSVYFAQEARVYSLLMLDTGLVLWALAVFQRDPSSTKAAIAYVIFGTLSLYLHATALLFVVACGATVWVALLARGAPGRPALLKWTALNVAVILLGLPYLIHAATASHGGGLDWMPPLRPHEVAVSISAVAGGILMPYSLPAAPLAIALFAALTVSIYRQPPNPRAMTTLVAVPCVFAVLVMAVSLMRPLLLPRVLTWTTLPLCIVLAGQLLAVGRMRLAVFAATAAAFGVGLAFQITSLSSDKEPWRDAMHDLAPELERADLVVISPRFDPMVFSYYAPDTKNLHMWDAALPPTIMTWATERLGIPSISEADILAAIHTKRSVLIVANSLDRSYIDEIRAIVPASTMHEWLCGRGTCIGSADWTTEKTGPRADIEIRPSLLPLVSSPVAG